MSGHSHTSIPLTSHGWHHGVSPPTNLQALAHCWLLVGSRQQFCRKEREQFLHVELYKCQIANVWLALWNCSGGALVKSSHTNCPVPLPLRIGCSGQPVHTSVEPLGPLHGTYLQALHGSLLATAVDCWLHVDKIMLKRSIKTVENICVNLIKLSSLSS